MSDEKRIEHLTVENKKIGYRMYLEKLLHYKSIDEY